MLERMVLRNFKCFDALDLTCSPLTMLCGVNGMGKSSVIQALLVLRQSAASGELNRGKLVWGGELTDIGAGQDVLFEDAEENVITFELYHQAAPAALALTFRYSREADRLAADDEDLGGLAHWSGYPLRTDFQDHYEGVVAAYNREKDRPTIEQTFDALLKLAAEMDEEETRAAREGLDEESLAIFDLLTKPDLNAGDVKRIKAVAAGLLQHLKADRLRVDRWQEKEATRDAVQGAIRDFLWSDRTGLPGGYTDTEVRTRSEEVFRHVFRAYPTVPSPYYQTDAA